MKVTIRSQRIPTTTVEGNPKTLGNVKEMFSEYQYDFSNTSFVDYQTKAEYTRDSALIPNRSEVLFFLVPIKNKSGGGVGSGKKKVESVEVNIFEEAKAKICGILDDLKLSGASENQIENLVMGLRESDMDKIQKELEE